MWEVLDKCWYDPPSLKGDFARAFALEIALAASLDWITNIVPDGSQYTSKWHATYVGIAALRNKELLA